VLYLVDPIDEYAIQHVTEYDGKKLQSVSKEGLSFGGDEAEDKADKKRLDLYKDQYKPLTVFMAKMYGDKVGKVVVSPRVETTPCILVTSQYGNSANMERIMRSQAFSDPSKASTMSSAKTMEINPRHPLLRGLLNLFLEDKDSEQLRDSAWLLYDTALLQSGFAMDEPAVFAERMFRTMKGALKVESLDLEAELEIPEEEEEEAEAADEEAEAGGDAEDEVAGSDEL
jgi:HSP90 family molecular chaperone